MCTLWQIDLKLAERANKLHVNKRHGVKITDHTRTHEHYGETRFNADKTWENLSFEEAVARFCQMTNLTLTEPLLHFQEFKLK